MSYGGDGLIEKTVRVHVDAMGTQAILDIQGSIAGVDAEITKLNQQLSRGTIGYDEYNAAMKRAVAQQEQLNRQLQVAERYINTGSTALGGFSRQITQTGVQAAYMFDDLQYGFGAVVNNIMPILQPLGLVGAGIGIAAVAANQLWINWRPLTAALNPNLIEQTGTATEQLTKEMKGLAEQSHLTAEEMQRLSNLQSEIANKKAVAEFMGGASDSQAAVKKATTEFQKSGKAGLLDSAIHDAVSSDFIRNPFQRIEDAAQDGTLKDGEGKSVKIDKQMMAYGFYRDRLKKFYANSALLTREQDMLKRLSKDGDSGAVDELGGMLKATGRHEEGPIADLMTDLTNAQSGIGSQKELDAIGTKNSRDFDSKKREESKREKDAIEQKARTAADSERNSNINRIATLYKTKEQGAIDKIIASGILEKRADAEVEAEVAAHLKGKMTGGLVPADIIGDASNQAAKAAIDKSRATVMAEGDTPQEGAKVLLDEVAAKAQKVAATGQRAAAKETAAARVKRIADDMTSRDNRVVGPMAENLGKRISQLQDTEGREYEDAIRVALDELNNKVDAHSDAGQTAMAGRQRRRQNEAARPQREFAKAQKAAVREQHAEVKADHQADLDTASQGFQQGYGVSPGMGDEMAKSYIHAVDRGFGHVAAIAAGMDVFQDALHRQEQINQQLMNQNFRMRGRQSGLPLAPRIR